MNMRSVIKIFDLLKLILFYDFQLEVMAFSIRFPRRFRPFYYEFDGFQQV